MDAMLILFQESDTNAVLVQTLTFVRSVKPRRLTLTQCLRSEEMTKLQLSSLANINIKILI
jgi:hypothetical protein